MTLASEDTLNHCSLLLVHNSLRNSELICHWEDASWSTGNVLATASEARPSDFKFHSCSLFQRSFYGYNIEVSLSQFKHGISDHSVIRDPMEMCKGIILEAIERTNWQLDIRSVTLLTRVLERGVDLL